MEFFGLMAFFMVMMYIGVPKEQKALSRRVKQLEKINQGGKTLMSQMIQDLVGSTCMIYLEDGFQTHPYEILKVDEDWVQIRRNLKRSKEEVRIVRIHDIKELRPVDKSIYHFIKEKNDGINFKK